MALTEAEAARLLELGFDLRRAAVERAAIALRPGFAQALLTGPPVYERAVVAEDAARCAFAGYISELRA